MATGATLYALRTDRPDCRLDGEAVFLSLQFLAAEAVAPAVVNLSFGVLYQADTTFQHDAHTNEVDTLVWGDVNRLFASHIRTLTSRGIPVVVSAGNDQTDACAVTPAGISEVVTVGATNRDDELWAYPLFPLHYPSSGSNWGECVDIFAPGHDLGTAASGGGTQQSDGTSVAAPMVAGAIALYLERFPSAGMSAVGALLEAATKQAVNASPVLAPHNRILNVVDLVPPLPPVARFGIPSTIVREEVLSVVDSSLVSEMPGSVQYRWDWGDMSLPDTIRSPKHAFAASGDYIVTLTLSDIWGRSHTAVRQIRVVGPHVISIVSGNRQAASNGTELIRPLVVRVTNHDGVPIGGAAVRWSPSSGTVDAIVDTTDWMGEAEARWRIGAGAIQTLEAAALEGSVAVTFRASDDITVRSVAIRTQNPDTIAQTQTRVLLAQAYNATGDEIVGAPIRWHSWGYASIDSITGVVTGRVVTQDIIKATTGSVTAAVTMQVVRPGVSVWPNQVKLTRSQTIQLTARVTDHHGVTIPGAVATWQGTSAVSVNEFGVAQALQETWSTVVSATYSGVKGNVGFQVVRPTITLAPSGSITIPRGDSLQLQAIVLDHLGVAMPGVTVTWSPTTSSPATVTSTGLLTGNWNGQTIVKAAALGATANLGVTVQ